MKKYIYTVKGLLSEESGREIAEGISRVIPLACDVEFNTDASSLSFVIYNEAEYSQKDAELKLSGALSLMGYELILPEGVEKFAYVGKKVKPPKTIPVQLAISLIAAFMALTMLFTFTAYDLFGGKGSSNVGIGNGTQIVVNNENIPDYIKELIKLDQIFKINSYEGIDEEEMGAAVLKAYIAATGDYYAEYMTEEEYAAYLDDSAAKFVGVGISVVNTVIEVGGYSYKVMQIISVFENSPAIENDVRVGDFIFYVGGGEEKAAVNAIGYDEALDRMLGEAGTQAVFTVLRKDESSATGYREIEFSISRRKVESESVKYRVSETDSKVGIINVTGFDMKTAVQFCDAVDTLKDMGCEYFVFDMRNNPGGSLYSIEAVLSYFLDKGDLILSTEYAGGAKEEFYVKETYYGADYAGYNVSEEDIGKYKDLKTVVLTNQNTASAAELFTATFRDYGIGEIVGTKTYGKGCMQNILDLGYYGMEGALRVTTAMYFSKSHTVYHEIGIQPDYPVELSEAALNYNFFLMPEEVDDQLQKAIEVLTK